MRARHHAAVRNKETIGGNRAKKRERRRTLLRREHVEYERREDQREPDRQRDQDRPDDLLAALWPAARARLAPGGEVLVHGADDGDRFAPPAALGGAVTIARYTPGDGPGFAITRWRPDASPVHRRGVIVLDAAHPFVRRADLDAIAGDGPHVGVDLR